MGLIAVEVVKNNIKTETDLSELINLFRRGGISRKNLNRIRIKSTGDVFSQNNKKMLILSVNFNPGAKKIRKKMEKILSKKGRAFMWLEAEKK